MNVVHVFTKKTNFNNRGKGEPITRYEIQRLVLDQHHPDWDKGRESLTTGETLTTTTTTTTTGSGESNTDDENASTANPTTPTTTTTATGTESFSAFKTPGEGGGQGTADTPDKAAGSGTPVEAEPGSAVAAQETGVGLPSVIGGNSGAGSGHSMGDDRKQVGVWIGQRTDKLTPYHTAGGLPTYCRCGSCQNKANTEGTVLGVPAESGGGLAMHVQHT